MARKSKRLNKIGKKGQFIQGMRVTDEETMEVVEWVLAGEVQQDIVGLINAAGGKAVGLTGRDGGLIRARKLRVARHSRPQQGTRCGPGGRDRRSTPAWSRPCKTTSSFRSSAPSALARKTRATTSTPTWWPQAGRSAQGRKAHAADQHQGVLDKEGNLLTDLTARQIDDLIADGTISGGMIPKIAGALDAAKSGVNAVHIVDGPCPTPCCWKF